MEKLTVSPRKAENSKLFWEWHPEKAQFSSKMAVTHEDLRPSRRSTDLSSKAGAFLAVFTIFLGLFCFLLCLTAEATRSEVRWLGYGKKGKEESYECVYSGSGRTPLLCAGSSFVGLAIAVLVQHMFLLIAVSKSPPQAFFDLDPSFSSSPPKSLTWQACFFFVATWNCFAVGEILLLIGLSVESGHLKNWDKPKQSCLVLKKGLFSAAGVFALATVFLASGLYLTALRAEKVFVERQNVRREVLEASAFHASPPRSPHRRTISTIRRENPVTSFRESIGEPVPFPIISKP